MIKYRLAAADPKETLIRELSRGEHDLVEWLLENGKPDARQYLDHLENASVASECPCGCASIDFAIDERKPHARAGMEVLSDYFWHADGGELLGVFVFAKNDQLAGLEVWSVDGNYATPPPLPPNTDVLRLKSAIS